MRPHPHLYEIAAVPWLIELTQREGRRITLGTVPDRAWDELEALDFDFVWLMGVWQRSPLGRRIAQDLASLQTEYERALPGFKRGDVVGSPYSVQFYEPDVLVGSWEELASARKALADRGIGLILDFVPNHTALDHDWATSHPEYYVQATAEDFDRSPQAYLEVEVDGILNYLARGKDPHFPAWTDTLQLDYFHEPTQRAMVEQLREISSHCDGVRCDMAMLVLNEVFARTWREHGKNEPLPREFWQLAREAVPNTLLLAEAYWNLEGRLFELGFDYCYDKGLYDEMRDGSALAVRRRLEASVAHQARLARFVENHDEPRAKVAFGPRLAPASVLTATAPGLRFFHHGQLEGREVRVPVQLMRSRAEAVDEAISAFYKNLLGLADHPVFHQGSFAMATVHPYDGDPSSEDLVAYSWTWKQTRRAIAVNLTGSAVQARVIWDLDLPDGPVRITDLLSREHYDREGGEMKTRGLHVWLAPYQSHVFEI